MPMPLVVNPIWHPHKHIPLLTDVHLSFWMSLTSEARVGTWPCTMRAGFLHILSTIHQPRNGAIPLAEPRLVHAATGSVSEASRSMRHPRLTRLHLPEQED